MRDEIIVRNSVRCLDCGGEIVSGHRHDFKYCSCGNVAVDGGHAYTRRLFKDRTRWIDTSIFAEPDASREQQLEGAAMLRWINSGARPPDDAWTTAPTLDEWSILPARGAAAGGMFEIEGVVSGHPDFCDGTMIRTTPLLFADHVHGWARTITRFWRLGTRAKETMK